MTDGAPDHGSRSAGFGHTPVMLERVDQLLRPAVTRGGAQGTDAVLVDCTLGMGGHTEHFLQTYPQLRVIGLDRDAQALEIATDRLAPFADRLTTVHTRYDGIGPALAGLGLSPTDAVDAVLMDLGVSSIQLDRAERGFAYAQDAPLDMRMDRSEPLTAAEVVNTYDKSELTRILRVYGEERFAGRIVAEILRRRAERPYRTTGDLVETLYAAIPAAGRRTGGHPAKRTFQALRVEVNAELDSLAAAAPAALDALRIGGRAVFMSYQSLEDRVVKKALAPRIVSRSPLDLPMELPGTEPEFTMITRGAERADDREIDRNPRSAPARVRCAERITERPT